MENTRRTVITFLGTAGAIPDPGSDTASFLINDRYLVDTGWSAVENLRKRGVDPLRIEALLFTHMHHDHYISLPSFLFYLLMKNKKLNELKIIGPIDDVEKVVKLALDFLQKNRFYSERDAPTVIPLSPGDSYEEEHFKVDTCATKHPVQGLCYRFTDKDSATVFSFTGDTAYYPPIADHVKGSRLLIHEAALGPISADPSANSYLHSGALDAAKIAESANVGKLVLLHGSLRDAEACVQAAARIFSKQVVWPKEGETISFE